MTSGQPPGYFGNTPLWTQPEDTDYEVEYFGMKHNEEVVSYEPDLNSDGSFFSLFKRTWLQVANKKIK